jgi:hypothetical protein
MAATMINVFWDFVPCSTVSKLRFREHTASIFRVSYVDSFTNLYYREYTVTETLNRGAL